MVLPLHFDKVLSGMEGLLGNDRGVTVFNVVLCSFTVVSHFLVWQMIGCIFLCNSESPIYLSLVKMYLIVDAYHL